MKKLWLVIGLCLINVVSGVESETLPKLVDDVSPQNYAEMWHGFDPRAEPLETEVIREWEEDGVVMRIVRFRIGVFKGKQAKLAAVYGFPKGGKDLPGLLQIHGGGQYADHKACLMNAKRGYATLSIAWAGRISAPEYRVGSDEVKLYWDRATDHANYKRTTDWGALDGYHAPSRNKGNQFPSAKAASWTFDSIESPRNSGWFLSAVAARRALTFLEQQPEVNADKLGVYGHSMGGKLTVMTAPDPRVKAAAPSCGGISDRDNTSKLFRNTLGDNISLNEIECPVIFLSPANDFHGRIGDLPQAIKELGHESWRVTCSPHHNHQDTAPYEVATLLWFDQHLKGLFSMPSTPDAALNLNATGGVPRFTVVPDRSRPVVAVDIYYTQHGLAKETSADRDNTVHRFWRHVDATQRDGSWTAELPLASVDQPLWAYANVTYGLTDSVAGAGYYYRPYETDTFNLSSLLIKVSSDQLRSAGVQKSLPPATKIESFGDGWQKEWFSYSPDSWPRSTNKLYDELHLAPTGAVLALDVKADLANELVVLIDQHAATVSLEGGGRWQHVVLSPGDFESQAGDRLSNWDGVMQLKLSDVERLRPPRGGGGDPRVFGKSWKGAPPQFRDLRWQASSGAQ